MKGRLERDIRIRNHINNLLKDMPDYCNGFYRTMENLERQTCLTYIQHLKSFLKFANKPINEIDETCIGEYFENISIKFDKYGKVVETSASYKKVAHTALTKFFEYAYKKKLVSDNPMDLIERTKRKDVVRRKSLTMDELNKVLEEAKYTQYVTMWRFNRRNYLALYLLMYTGMREGALIQINVSDIDFEEKILTVVDKRNKTLVYELDDKVINLINEWLEYRSQILKEKNVSSDALFIGNSMGRLSETGIYNIVKGATKRALGYSISPHKLRSTFITLYYEASGHDIEATRLAVGHENIETTSRYIAKDNSARKKAGKFMSDSLI